ncbi:peptidoglycan DD-metalloendopeptidase family protein [Halobacteriovorax sp. XZX-3]|uniref:murein hydrolase activator EnvC family protein n=1 Tax=unclassified Halobacteriovorax TaxID=2639665 RepID=UPI003713C617
MAKSLVLFTVLLITSASMRAEAAPNLNAIKGQVTDSRSKIDNYKKSIQSIETQLQTKNEDYLQAMKSRQDLDYQIFELEKNLNQSLFDLESDKVRVKKTIRHVALSYMENSTHEDLVKSQLLLKSLKNEKKEIQSKIDYCTDLKKKTFELRTRLSETVKIERELYTLLQELETRKSSTVQEFLTEKENHEKLKSEYSKLRKSQQLAKKKAQAKLKVSKNKASSSSTKLVANFAVPVKKFISTENGKKGITYTVKSGQEIFATKAGKVEYVGSLANVGNVIMVDHGNDIRSIYLGDFAASVKKGQAVDLGSSVAKTRFSIKKGNLSKVYFEIRKKNTAQNTAQLINNKINI